MSQERKKQLSLQSVNSSDGDKMADSSLEQNLSKSSGFYCAAANFKSKLNIYYFFFIA